jgi:hypothetical protein
MLKGIVEANRAADASNDAGEAQAVMDRIQDFFFRRERGARKESVPSFLNFARRPHSVPCSFRELAQEIEWYARQPAVGWFQTDITLVLGTAEFPPHDPTQDRIVPALQRAVQAKVPVRFVLPDNSPPPAYTSGFEVLRLIPKESSRRGKTGQDLPAVPCRHLLFMRSLPPRDPAFSSHEPELTLLYFHEYSPRHPYLEHTPVVSSATPSEEEAFGAWLDRFLASADKSHAKAPKGGGNKA